MDKGLPNPKKIQAPETAAKALGCWALTRLIADSNPWSLQGQTVQKAAKGAVRPHPKVVLLRSPTQNKASFELSIYQPSQGPTHFVLTNRHLFPGEIWMPDPPVNFTLSSPVWPFHAMRVLGRGGLMCILSAMGMEVCPTQLPQLASAVTLHGFRAGGSVLSMMASRAAVEKSKGYELKWEIHNMVVC